MFSLFPQKKARKQAEGQAIKVCFLPFASFFILPVKSDTAYKSCFVIKEKLSRTQGTKKKEEREY